MATISQPPPLRLRAVRAGIPCIWSVALLLTLAIALRLNAGGVPGEPYLRALIVRGFFFGVGFAAAASLPLFIAGRPVRRAAAFALAIGVALNAALTMALALRYDGPLLAAAAGVSRQSGSITLRFPTSGAISLKRAANGSWERTEPLDGFTPLEAHIACAAEDERCNTRLLPLDPVGLARAAAASSRSILLRQRSELQGASDLAEQVAGLTLWLKPHGRGLEAFRTKAAKTLAGFRVDDLFDRDKQMALYLSLCPFGSLDGHEVVGLPAAALVYYGRPHASLTAAQLSELMARLRNPNIYFPYRKAGEGEAHFEQRLEMLRRRTLAILSVARREKWIGEPAFDAAGSAFLDGLVDRQTALTNLLPGPAAAMAEEAASRDPDFRNRHLVADTAYDGRIQAAVEKAVAAITPELRRRLPGKWDAGDAIDTDAVIVERGGGIVARHGLVTIPGGMASNLKPELYGLALELGALGNLDERARGAGVPAWLALAQSRNRESVLLGVQTGLARYAGHLRSQGYFVTAPVPAIVLGAGVTGSPLLVAGNFIKFGYSNPGVRVEPGLIVRLTDAASGAALYTLPRTGVFRSETATAVRNALERVSTMGTARHALAALASAAPIAAKTGTAGFFRRGHWMGEGGSWCVAVDSATGLTIAVRVRWHSGHPFQLEGGQSAALIVRQIIADARLIAVEDSQR
jgi:membrane peptidoglycan carboxypeptidase